MEGPQSTSLISPDSVVICSGSAHSMNCETQAPSNSGPIYHSSMQVGGLIMPERWERDEQTRWGKKENPIFIWLKIWTVKTSDVPLLVNNAFSSVRIKQKKEGDVDGNSIQQTGVLLAKPLCNPTYHLCAIHKTNILVLMKMHHTK